MGTREGDVYSHTCFFDWYTYLRYLSIIAASKGMFVVLVFLGYALPSLSVIYVFPESDR